jgi:hypothetical protein
MQTGDGWKPVHGWAEPVDHSATLAAPCGVRLLSRPDLGGAAQLEAPAGAVEPGHRFAVRYFQDGAKRVVLEARSVTPRGGQAVVEAVPLGGAEPAPQRRSERATISVAVTARTLDCARLPSGELLDLEVVNVSAGGVLFRSDLPLGYGDTLRLETDAGLADLRIVRRDPRGPRLAGAFLDEEAGAAAYRALLERA